MYSEIFILCIFFFILHLSPSFSKIVKKDSIRTQQNLIKALYKLLGQEIDKPLLLVRHGFTIHMQLYKMTFKILWNIFLCLVIKKLTHFITTLVEYQNIKMNIILACEVMIFNPAKILINIKTRIFDHIQYIYSIFSVHNKNMVPFLHRL